MATKKKTDGDVATLDIAPLVVHEFSIQVIGTAPLLIHAWGKKGGEIFAPKPPKKDRPPKDYEADFNDARHISAEGWDGVAAASFRMAGVRAITMLGGAMTDAKLMFMVLHDGIDKADGTMLVRLNAGAPQMDVRPVRIQKTVDMRARPMYFPWSATLRIQHPAHILPQKIIALMDYAGAFVGVGEGRPFSKDSGGMGLGTFRVTTDGAL